MEFLEPFGAFSTQLEPFRAIWSHLEQFGAIWSNLEPLRAKWSFLDPFQAIWSYMEPFGVIWSVLEIGHYVSKLKVILIERAEWRLSHSKFSRKPWGSEWNNPSSRAGLKAQRPRASSAARIIILVFSPESRPILHVINVIAVLTRIAKSYHL